VKLYKAKDIPSAMFSYELDSEWNRQAEHRHGTDEVTELKTGGLMISLKEGRGPNA
jgi:hypothetical protein